MDKESKQKLITVWVADLQQRSLSLSLVDQVTFNKDLRELLNQGDHGAKRQSCFQFKVGLLPRSNPLQNTWDWWQYYEFPDNLKNSLMLAGLSNLSVDIKKKNHTSPLMIAAFYFCK